jgi:electron transfer flavoprotein beta subunit
MKIAVCVKQIPDPATPYELDPESHWVIRPEDQVLDDTDRYGIEVGLQIAEANEGTITLYSMSPAGSLQGIRQALSMGADRAVIVDDDTLRGAEALATARVLAAAIARDGFDVVVAGTESTDGYSGVVPQMMAELLDVPALSFARSVEITADGARIERQTAVGYDVVESSLPVLMTVTSGAVEPRYPTFKGIMEAKKKPIDQITAADLGLGDEVGVSASGQAIVDVSPIPARSGGEVIEDDGEAHVRVMALLEQAKVI